MKNTMIIKLETINRLLSVIATDLANVTYVRVHFGVNVISEEDGIVANHLILSTSSSQMELIFNGKMEELPGNVSVDNPYKVMGFNAAEFHSVLSALAEFDTDFIVEIADKSISIDVGNATMAINAVDTVELSPVIPTKNNSLTVSEWDKDIAVIRVSNKALSSAYTLAGAVTNRIAEGTTFFRVKDAEPTFVEVEQDMHGQKVIRKVMTSNAVLSIVNADGTAAFSFATANVAIKKGIAKGALSSFVEKEKLNEVMPCILSIEEENGEKKPTLTPYADYMAEYNKSQNINAGVDELYFALSIEFMARVMKLVSISGGEENGVFVSVGEKYITVLINEIGVMYTIPRIKFPGNKLMLFLAQIEGAYRKAGDYLAVSANELNKAVKLQTLKSDLYFGGKVGAENPIVLTFKKSGIEMNFKDALSVTPATEEHTRFDKYLFGVNPQYLKIVTGALKKDVRLYYGDGERSKAIFFTDGSLENGNGLIICGVKDVDKAQEDLEKKKAEVGKKKTKEPKKEAKES